MNTVTLPAATTAAALDYLRPKAVFSLSVRTVRLTSAILIQVPPQCKRDVSPFISCCAVISLSIFYSSLSAVVIMGVGLPHSLARRAREGEGEGGGGGERAPGANRSHAHARRRWRTREGQNQVKSKVPLHRRLVKMTALSFPPSKPKYPFELTRDVLLLGCRNSTQDLIL